MLSIFILCYLFLDDCLAFYAFKIFKCCLFALELMKVLSSVYNVMMNCLHFSIVLILKFIYITHMNYLIFEGWIVIRCKQSLGCVDLLHTLVLRKWQRSKKSMVIRNLLMNSSLRYQSYMLIKNMPKASLFTFKPQIMDQLRSGKNLIQRIYKFMCKFFLES